jgi:hypothetical protein
MSCVYCYVTVAYPASVKMASKKEKEERKRLYVHLYISRNDPIIVFSAKKYKLRTLQVLGSSTTQHFINPPCSALMLFLLHTHAQPPRCNH